jgi:cbb3-type cytochrome oxidase maturation protein
MDILVLLIPLSVVLAVVIGGGFWWAVKSGQFDDLEGPAHRILADDDSGGADDVHASDDALALRREDRLTEVKPRADERP